MIDGNSTLVNDLEQNNEIFLLDFYGDWCRPCKIMIPVLEKIEPDYQNIKFIKVNIDKNSDLVEKYNITSVPTLMFYSGSNNLAIIKGIQKESDIRNILNKVN